jgi:hypothetical protein|tara:strand:+ start:4143 stop:4373 length:231 start_codon:yes stop_codon:yes gene_type:complete
MIGALLSALSALPRIASALEAVAGSLDAIDKRNREARAANRRATKDKEVDSVIDALVADKLPDDQPTELTTSDGEG